MVKVDNNTITDENNYKGYQQNNCILRKENNKNKYNFVLSYMIFEAKDTN